jgi:hypothetical protein
MHRSSAPWVVAVFLILVSGAFMVWAGYAFAQGRIAAGLWITTPPGFTIQAAFGLVRRADRARGIPKPPLVVRLGQEAVILLAGAVMVGAGYAGALWNWVAAAFLILLGAPVIGGALWLGRRRSRTPQPIQSLEGASGPSA